MERPISIGDSADDDLLWQRIGALINEERDRQNSSSVPEPESMVSSLARQVPGAGLAVTAAQNVRRGFNRLPTPGGALGGLGALLFVAIVLRLALVPVREDGTTGLELLFAAMTGRASLGSGGSADVAVPPPPAVNTSGLAVKRLVSSTPARV